MDPWLDLESLTALREIARSPGGLTRAQLVERVGSSIVYNTTPRLERLGYIRRNGDLWHAGEPLPDPRDAVKEEAA